MKIYWILCCLMLTIMQSCASLPQPAAIPAVMLLDGIAIEWHDYVTLC